MAAKHTPITIQSERDLGPVVRDAITSGPVLVELNATIYEVEVRPASARRDSLFNIVGISRDGEPTDVARHKDEYLTEASEPRPQ